jgi:hypothetical protein
MKLSFIGGGKRKNHRAGFELTTLVVLGTDYCTENHFFIKTKGRNLNMATFTC